MLGQGHTASQWQGFSSDLSLPAADLDALPVALVAQPWETESRSEFCTQGTHALQVPRCKLS